MASPQTRIVLLHIGFIHSDQDVKNFWLFQRMNNGKVLGLYTPDRKRCGSCSAPLKLADTGGYAVISFIRRPTFVLYTLKAYLH